MLLLCLLMIMNGQRAPAEAHKVAADHDPAAVNGERATAAVAAKRGFSRRAEVVQVVLRVLTLVGLVMAMTFMLTAKQSGVTSVYGFQLSVSSQWSNSSAFEFICHVVSGWNVGDCCSLRLAASAYYWIKAAEESPGDPLKKTSLAYSCRGSGDVMIKFLMFCVSIFAYAMVSAGSAASGITNLNRTGIKHTALPNFCKALPSFCDHIAISIAFAFFSFVLFAASALQIVTWLSKS
ncbi:hypothetical protein JRO89_XS09G0180900 [Xanthoceras sorbifolium]|uniref:CASP-like protein n=1 Tax=Xanthoceras sorbifolium TaxID=99658 RepID=A0ABQ8HLQ2_9ROSI|nr:hypothetical protein JRO89_XS09G0180900 [Xanthoceras sorbifolium]